MKEILALLKSHGYKQVSLSVQKAAKKHYSSLDRLDRRNGYRTGIVFSREMCYTLVSKQTDKPEFGRRNNKVISLHEIDFSNRNFWVGYMATSFPTALEEETDMSLTELMTENGMCDTSWWDNFIKYYDGVLEKSDGNVDEPETLICELAPTQTLKIEFHPGDTVYFINDKQIACTSGHYNIQVIPFKELLNSIKNRQIFLLLLPLAVIDNQDKDKATQIVSNVLQEIFDKHLCNQYAGCIVTGLMSE